MKPFNSYKDVKPFTETEKLPAGGYIIGITDASETSASWGNVLEIKFDICEGDFKNYYTNQYKNSQFENKKYKGIYRLNIPKDDGSDEDMKTARIFVTAMGVIEDSNPGYRWDWNEKLLVGKKVGAIFFEKEYEFNGRKGFFTTIYGLKSIEAINNNKYKIPVPKMLNNQSSQSTDQSFFKVDGNLDDEDLPF